jgi:hypothetical protein
MEPLSLDQSAFMVTYTGKPFYLYQPDVFMIDIRDIAHALSMLCRFTGHTRRFYSVAQHCVHASALVPHPHEKDALLHDAAEAYINDLSRPLKHHPNMSAYLELEARIERVITECFMLGDIHHRAIKNVDNALVCTEANQLMSEHGWTEGHNCYDFDLPAWGPDEAEFRFLKRFHELT